MQYLKRFSKDALIYGVGDGFLKLFGFVTVPIYTRIFTTVDYGVLNLIGAFTGILAVVINLGLSGGTQKYYHEEKTITAQSELISTGLWGLMFWGLCIFGIGFLCSPFIARYFLEDATYSPMIRIAFFAIPLAQMVVYCLDTLRLQFKSKQFTMVNLSNQILQIIFAFSLVVFLNFGLEGFFIGQILTAITTLLLCIYCLRAHLKLKFNRHQFNTIVHFGYPCAISGLAGPAFMFIDRFIVEKNVGLEALGLLAFGYTIITACNLIGGVFARTWNPLIWDIKNNDPNYRRIFADVLVYLLAIFGLLAVGITTFAREIIALLAPLPYRESAMVIGPLALYMVANFSIQVTAIGISITAKTKYLAYCTWTAITLNIILDLILVQYFGIMGVTIATAIAESLLTIALCAISQKLHPLPYQYHKIITAIALILLFITTSYLFPKTITFGSFLGKTLFCLLFALSIILFNVIPLSLLKKAKSILFGDNTVLTIEPADNSIRN